MRCCNDDSVARVFSSEAGSFIKNLFFSVARSPASLPVSSQIMFQARAVTVRFQWFGPLWFITPRRGHNLTVLSTQIITHFRQAPAASTRIPRVDLQEPHHLRPPILCWVNWGDLSLLPRRQVYYLQRLRKQQEKLCKGGELISGLCQTFLSPTPPTFITFTVMQLK